MASSKSKFFRVATEGATVDGRDISRDWIAQMAETYDPKTYGARVNLEHIRGTLPDSPFRAYGDVLALKAEERDGKLALFAQIDPTDDLVKMTKARQKIYSSMEVDPDFAKTGKAYLVALAVTDNPASLGTEMLQFCAQAGKNPLSDRKQRPENFISEAVEFSLEFEEAQQTEGLSLFSKVKELLTGKNKQDAERFADTGAAVEAIAESQRGVLDRFAALESEQKKTTEALQKLTSTVETDTAGLAQLRTELGKTEQHSKHRPTATGAGSSVVTDC